MEAPFGDVELARKHSVVELLNVEQLHIKCEPARINDSRQQSMEGERVVGAG
jgi:hypothetical protein